MHSVVADCSSRKWAAGQATRENCGARLRFLVLDQNGRGVHHFATICRPSGVSLIVSFLCGSWAPTAVPRVRALLVRPRVRSLLLRAHCDECVSHEHRAWERRHEAVSKKGGSQKLVTRSSNITSPRQPDIHSTVHSFRTPTAFRVASWRAGLPRSYGAD